MRAVFDDSDCRGEARQGRGVFGRSHVYLTQVRETDLMDGEPGALESQRPVPTADQRPGPARRLGVDGCVSRSSMGRAKTLRSSRADTTASTERSRLTVVFDTDEFEDRQPLPPAVNLVVEPEREHWSVQREHWTWDGERGHGLRFKDAVGDGA